MADLNKKLCLLAKALNVKFTFRENFISHEEVFSDTGLLPALAKRADQLCSLCLGYGIGAIFPEAEKSLIGVKVQFDDITPNILRLLCICDVLNELVKAAPSKDSVSLDELMYD
jgi:intracellular multiplication protein IcmS